jgi:hypothetical protein
MPVKVTCLTILTILTVFSRNIREYSRLHHLYLYQAGSLFPTNKASLIEYHILFETDTI